MTRQSPQHVPSKPDADYERWRQDMLFYVYGPQNQKTWDINSPWECKRVGNRR